MDMARLASSNGLAMEPDAIAGNEKQILAWITHANIVGFIIGPLIGSVLYAYLGSMNTFFIFGSFLVFFAVIIKMNFNGDAEVEDLDDTYFEGSYRGDNQFKFGEDLSSFRNDVTPERTNERDCFPTDYDQSFDALQ